MEKKLKRIIDDSVFETLILEGKKGIFTNELYKIGEKIWKEAQNDVFEKLKNFEKQEKIMIITEDDKELLHGFDYTQEQHIATRKKFNEFLRKTK